MTDRRTNYIDIPHRPEKYRENLPREFRKCLIYPYAEIEVATTADHIALAILRDLSDRRGIKWELEKIDEDVRRTLLSDIAEIVRYGVNNAFDLPLRAESCNDCQGVGSVSAGDTDEGIWCKTCDGIGRVIIEKNSPKAIEEARHRENLRRYNTGGLPVCEECDARGQCLMNCGPAAGRNYWPDGEPKP